MKTLKVIVFFLFLSGLCFRAIYADEDNSGSGNSSDSENNSIDIKGIFDEGSGNRNTFTTPQAKPVRSSPVKTMETYSKPGGTSVGGGAGAKNLSSVNPDRYFLQPGDALNLQLWLPAKLEVSGVVSPMGTITIPPVGDLQVKGVLLSQLSSNLEKQLGRYYKDVHVTANLADVRVVRAQVLGEVKNPGSYEAPGTYGALDFIGLAGGLLDRASLRQIELQKDGKTVQKLDYFRWRVFGDEGQNPYLEPNEVLVIHVLKNAAQINGEVERPGNYEFIPGETFGDLLHMAGGYTPVAAAGESKISRVTESHAPVTISPVSETALAAGDTIYVPPITLFQEKIRVMGEINGVGVFQPAAKGTLTAEPAKIGWYHLHAHERVRDVVLNMGGLTPKADAARARIERKNSKGEIEYIAVNLQKLFAENDMTQNAELKDGDTLVIPSMADSVYVVGEVNKPSVYPYMPSNGVREYVALAGGPTSHANMSHAKLVRAGADPKHPEVYNLNLKHIFQGYSYGKEVTLEPGDVIFVPYTSINGVSDVLNFLGNISIVRALFFH